MNKPAATVIFVWNVASDTVMGTGDTAKLRMLASEAKMISSGSEFSGEPKNVPSFFFMSCRFLTWLVEGFELACTIVIIMKTFQFFKNYSEC